MSHHIVQPAEAQISPRTEAAVQVSEAGNARLQSECSHFERCDAIAAAAAAEEHLKEIMTSSNTDNSVKKRDADDKPGWMTHGSHMAGAAGESRPLTAWAQSHGRLPEREKSGEVCFCRCVMIPGTARHGTLLSVGRRRSAGTAVCSSPRSVSDGKPQKGGWEDADRLRGDGWFSSRSHRDTTPAACVPPHQRERGGREGGGGERERGEAGREELAGSEQGSPATPAQGLRGTPSSV